MARTMIHANKRGLAINALKQEDMHYCHNCNFNGALAIVTTEIAALSLRDTRRFGVRPLPRSHIRPRGTVEHRINRSSQRVTSDTCSLILTNEQLKVPSVTT